jgi:hypothetical protein
MALVQTRLQVGDYDAWKPMFDLDAPGARRDATRYTLFRGVDDPNEVFIQIEFETEEQARASRERLLASGVLDRFTDKHGPTVVVVAEASGA